MANLEELLAALPEADLREALRGEIAQLKKRTRFGLVYERHIPETVLVGNIPIRLGDTVRPRQSAETERDLRVVAVNGDAVTVVPVGSSNGDQQECSAAELIVVKGFGEPVYPTLTPIDD